MKSWKKFEATVAEILGGTRNVRTSYSQSISDIDHMILSIECKLRKKLPDYLEKDVKAASAGLQQLEITRKIPSFILNGLRQAGNYDPIRLPLLAIKQKQRRIIIGVMWADDVDIEKWDISPVLWKSVVLFDLKNLKPYVRRKKKKAF